VALVLYYGRNLSRRNISIYFTSLWNPRGGLYGSLFLTKILANAGQFSRSGCDNLLNDRLQLGIHRFTVRPRGNMMKNMIRILAVLGVGLIASCSDSEPASTDVPEAKPETVFQPQIDAMEKARGIEKLLQQSSDEQKKLIESEIQ
jgi:hypothetical protein